MDGATEDEKDQPQSSVQNDDGFPMARVGASEAYALQIPQDDHRSDVLDDWNPGEPRSELAIHLAFREHRADILDGWGVDEPSSDLVWRTHAVERAFLERAFLLQAMTFGRSRLRGDGLRFLGSRVHR